MEREREVADIAKRESSSLAKNRQWNAKSNFSSSLPYLNKNEQSKKKKKEFFIINNNYSYE